ncbi:MAG: hypothetical protein NTY88_05550 [Bacteroidetes bacterium]|nr:hypothetical protein [Bacteroidota bacterium]
MRHLFYFLVIVFCISSCKKETVYRDVIIPGNVPPPDYSIDSATINIYVNKAYINIIGREPVGSERTDALVVLRQHNFSVADRKQFVQALLNRPEVNSNLVILARSEYLGNTDSFDIAQQIFVYQNGLTIPDYAPFYPLIRFEITRLDTLQTTLQQMNAGTCNYREMLRRTTNNYFYDQLNMGTENFVVSTFQNFLFRYPTEYELTNCKIMVEGQNSLAFLQTGKDKNDYLGIFFRTNDFYEGQVRYIYKKYLFREPNSAEMAYYAGIYKANENYKDLQLEIFSLDEYAGIH